MIIIANLAVMFPSYQPSTDKETSISTHLHLQISQRKQPASRGRQTTRPLLSLRSEPRAFLLEDLLDKAPTSQNQTVAKIPHPKPAQLGPTQFPAASQFLPSLLSIKAAL